MSDKHALIALLREQEAATARGDAAGVIAPLAPEFVTYDLPRTLEYRGTAAPYAEGLSTWFDTWEGG